MLLKKPFKIFLIILLLNFFAAFGIEKSSAEEFLLTVTPLKKLTTTVKSINEGDLVDFKVIEDCRKFKAGDIITGSIMYYEQNSFYGKEAKLTIGNFKTQSKKLIKGNLYLSGNEHDVFQEYSNYQATPALHIIRGGEIIVKPDINTLTFFVEE